LGCQRRVFHEEVKKSADFAVVKTGKFKTMKFSDQSNKTLLSPKASIAKLADKMHQTLEVYTNRAKIESLILELTKLPQKTLEKKLDKQAKKAKSLLLQKVS